MKIINSGDSQTGRIETIDNVKYYIDDATGECEAFGLVDKEVSSITLVEDVTAICRNAFNGCSNLTEITIPEGVISIGGSAFQNCTNLTEVSLPSTLQTIENSAFDECSSLTSITLPANLQTIGNSAFQNCYSLTSITLPASLQTIGNSAFSGCYALALVINNSTITITAGNSVGYYAQEVVNSEDTLQGRIEVIANVQYYINETTGDYIALAPAISRNAITSISLADGTKEINQYTFNGCSNLTEITIPEGVISIGDSAFSSCSSLATVTFAEGSQLESIGNSAFYGCSSLTEITLPSSLQTIDYSAFSGCYALAIVINNSTALSITKGGTNNGYVGFYAAKVNNSGDSQTGRIKTINNVKYYIDDATGEFIALSPINSELTSITIVEGTKEIRPFAFFVYSGLTEIILPSTLQTIGSSAFNGCSGLTEIILPSTLQTIGSSAFNGCSGLIEITLPSSLQAIGTRAFYKCTDLASITLPLSLQTIGDQAFYGCYSLATVINHSSLTITMGSSGNGYVAYYANEVIEDDVTVEGRIEVIDNVQYLINDSTGEFRAVKLVDTSVTSVEIVEGANALGENIFKNCNNLTEITLPSTITSLDFVFDVTSLYKISLPSTLTSICDRAFYSCENLAIVNFQGTIDQWVGIEFGYNWTNGRIALYINDIPANEVTINTDINAYAFYSIKSITSVTLGENVTIIGNSAFAECGRLQTVTFAQNSQLTTIGNGAFSDCVLLNGFVIPSGVESIGSSAFSGCKYLTEIEIPESVLTIGSYAFQNCSNLMTLTLPATLPTISSNAFSGAFDQVLADSAAKIYYQGDLNQWLNIDYNQKRWLSLNFNIDLYINGELMDEITITTDMKDYAFYGIDSITKVVIGEGVTTINAYAFSGCTNLTSVTISTSVISIGNYAFQNCDNLKNLTFVEGSQLQNIGDYSFQNCDSLTSITLPASLQTIGNYAFQNCYALALVINNSTILTIKNGGIDNGYVGCYAQEVVNSGETAQGRIEIIENMQYYVNEKTGDFIALAPSIPKSEVTTIELDSRTTSLCQYLFYECETLTSIIIPEGVKSIGIYAFNDCSGLTFITIPSTVESIGYYAFTGCSNLTDVTINSEYAYKYATTYRIYLLQYADIVRVKAELVGDDIINDSHSYLNSSNFNSIQLSEDGQYYIYTNI